MSPKNPMSHPLNINLNPTWTTGRLSVGQLAQFWCGIVEPAWFNWGTTSKTYGIEWGSTHGGDLDYFYYPYQLEKIAKIM